MININEAMLDPAHVFGSPKKILENDELTKEEKLAILKSWSYDERELMVAEEENMPNLRPTNHHDLFMKIEKAILKLGGRDTETSTKHG